MQSFSNREASEITGLSQVQMRQLKHFGLMPGAMNATRWTANQVLALTVRTMARRAGATPDAAHGAYKIMLHAKLPELRESCQSGKRLLRLLGDVVDGSLVTESCAFDQDALRKASQNGLPYVVVDVAYLLDKIDKSKPIRHHSRGVAVR